MVTVIIDIWTLRLCDECVTGSRR